MGMITCKECDKEISDNATLCPNCGNPISTNIKQKKIPISAILGIGIILFPILFSWVTLSKGYSTLGRIGSFVWLIIVLNYYLSYQYIPSTPVHLTRATTSKVVQQSSIKNDTKQEIIKRCKSEMSEYGASMVKACIDQDITAVNSINNYSTKYSSIINRCLRDMRSYGFAMVNACAKQDIDAQKAINNY